MYNLQIPATWCWSSMYIILFQNILIWMMTKIIFQVEISLRRIILTNLWDQEIQLFIETIKRSKQIMTAIIHSDSFFHLWTNIFFDKAMDQYICMNITEKQNQRHLTEDASSTYRGLIMSYIDLSPPVHGYYTTMIECAKRNKID